MLGMILDNYSILYLKETKTISDDNHGTPIIILKILFWSSLCNS